VIQDLLLRWIVTALSAFTAAQCVYGLAVNGRSSAAIVGHSLHVAMAVAMAAMAWPSGAGLPTTGPLVFFLMATAWFVAMARTNSRHRWANAYHAATMLAMAWMYAAMGGGPPSASSSVASADGHHGSSSMPGMDMSAADTTGMPGTSPLTAGLNWLFTIGFTIAGAWWLSRLFVRRRSEPAPPRARIGLAAQGTMATGMAITFATML
jgi:hypothetical protein